MLCVGDPDDQMEPLQSHPGRGTCRDVCWPEDEACAPGALCVRIGPRDDPETAEDEGMPLGNLKCVVGRVVHASKG